MIRAVIFDFYGVLNEGMEPNHKLLTYIKAQLKPRYKLGLLSNAEDEFMYQIIPEAKLKELFDDLIVSYKVGIAKPHPDIYKLALKNLGVQPAQAIFIDDLSKHLGEPEALGIKTILYQNFDQMRSELEAILIAPVSDN